MKDKEFKEIFNHLKNEPCYVLGYIKGAVKCVKMGMTSKDECLQDIEWVLDEYERANQIGNSQTGDNNG